jgi:ribonuclease-3
MVVLRRLFRWLRPIAERPAPEEAASEVNFRRLERTLDQPIHDKRLFVQALSHRSYLQLPGNENLVSNERLEFLGDSILNLVAAEFLYRLHTDAAEGELTKMRSRLVNRTALSIYARDLRLQEYMLMSPNAALVEGKGMETILADAYEAIVGAVYLDSGYVEATRFVDRTIRNAIGRGLLKTDDENFKSRLLEEAQAGGLGVPRYVTVNESGPDHDRTFTVDVIIGNAPFGTGTGKNKKEAEQAAAEKALQKLGVP